MGFGLLLCGYFVLTLMSFGIGDYRFVTYIIGAMVAARAAGKLRDYEPLFGFLPVFSVLYGLLSAYHVAAWLDNLFLWELPLREGAWETAASVLSLVTELGFTFVMLVSVRRLSGKVGLPKLTSRASANLFTTGVWGAGQLAVLLFPRLASAGEHTIERLLILLLIVVYVLNALLLHACFNQIGPSEDTPVKEKPLPFELANRLHRKIDESSAKAAEEDRAYLESRKAEKQRQEGKKASPPIHHKKRRKHK